MIRRSTLIAVEIVLGLVAALAIGLGVAWWRLSQGPLELSQIRDHVQSELSAARGGRPVSIDRVELAWTRNALELRAVGVRVLNEQGGVQSQADEARIELAVLPLVIGQIRLMGAEFRGGEITLTRKPDHALHVAFGPEGAQPDIIVPPSDPGMSLEARVARLLDGLEAAFRPVGAGGRLREITVLGATLNVIDEAGGGRWRADDARLELARQGRTLALEVDARLEAAEGAAPATLRITTDTRFQTAVVEFGAAQVRPRAVFSPAALGPFAGLDAPLTANISIGLDRARGVTRFEGDMTLGRGAADMAGGRFTLEGGSLRGRYDIASDELILDQLELAGDRTRIEGEVRVRDVSAIMRAAPDAPAAFNITLPSMRMAVPAAFAEPVAFSNVQVVGAIEAAGRTIRLTRLSAHTGDGQLEASGRVYWAEAGPERRLYPGVELNGALAGAVDVSAVMAAWPIGLGENTRAYLARALREGRVSDATIALDVRPSDNAAGVWRNEAVDVRFNVSGVTLQYISTMAPVQAARGAGVLRGNRFDLTIAEARINDLVITNGRVEAPRLRSQGAPGMLSISGQADGDARNMIELLLQEPLALGDRLPVEAASVTGRGSVRLTLQRPLMHDVQFEDWRFNIDGEINNFAGQMTSRRVALSNGTMRIRGDQRAVTVSGPVRAGASDIREVRWTEYLNRRGRASSEYQIAGVFDANDLQRLGYSVAAYARGRIDVTVSGEGRGFDVDQALVQLDLTAAAVQTPRGFWSKPAGEAARASFRVERQRDGGLAFLNVSAQGADMDAQGRMRLTQDGRVAEAEANRFIIEGRTNARLLARRGEDGGLDVTVRGAMFDAAPFMGADETPAPGAQAGQPSAPTPLRANVVVDRLRLRGGAVLSDARVDLAATGSVLRLLSAEGRTPNGGSFSLAMGPRPTDPQGRLRFRSDDAGFAVRALTGAENVVGGTASADGDWLVGASNRANFTVRMRDFQVVRLPAMARLLSSAGSLTGLVEMLNGDGIGFTALDARMAYANNQLSFSDGRMTGPSLGLTGAGAYDMRRDNLSIDGVVAPSPVLNLSMLGNVPVIGDLLVSRRGEGVFGMTYAINGRAAEPRVSVNPISALTPGILRRIFEPIQPRTAPPEPVGEGDAQEGAVAPMAEAGAP
ncbi:MAG: hypothetical protein JNK94_07660 [Hyphomonadaceae bacterium]|nr:hypothetical protein [Hyphomonadaceae bacterium]